MKHPVVLFLAAIGYSLAAWCAFGAEMTLPFQIPIAGILLLDAANCFLRILDGHYRRRLERAKHARDALHNNW